LKKSSKTGDEEEEADGQDEDEDEDEMWSKIAEVKEPKSRKADGKTEKDSAAAVLKKKRNLGEASKENGSAKAKAKKARTTDSE